MNALLIEEHPLLRLGLLQMLETIQESGHVLALAPADIGKLDTPYRNADLLVFGMPADEFAGWTQLELAANGLRHNASWCCPTSCRCMRPRRMPRGASAAACRNRPRWP